MEKLKMTTAMLIFGTIGIFVQWIPLPSPVIACFRAVIGTLTMLCVILLGRKKLNMEAMRKHAVLLLLSGTALGFNWVLLFESYRYASVAVGTLCYYMAPVFIILLSPFVLKERLTPGKILCAASAVVGIVLISGTAAIAGQDLRGILFGLAAAALYCSIVLLNKFIKGLSGIETTFCQLAISAVVMVVYVLFTEKVTAAVFSGKTVLLILIVGIIHTGISYLLYFSSVGKLPAQVSAVLSYIDPVTAIILSAILLHQPMTLPQIIGTVLILGAMLLQEVLQHRQKEN